MNRNYMMHLYKVFTNISVCFLKIKTTNSALASIMCYACLTGILITLIAYGMNI